MAALEALAALHAEHGHLQEVILQNFVPHQHYYGAGRPRSPTPPPANIGAPGRRRTEPDAPAWACEVTLTRDDGADHARTAADARGRHPGSAEPVGLVVRARSCLVPPPRRTPAPTAITSPQNTRSHRPVQVRTHPREHGYGAFSERLCVYPGFIDPEWPAGACWTSSSGTTGRSSHVNGSGRNRELVIAPDLAGRAIDDAGSQRRRADAPSS